jgi:hypothetical protein
MCTQVHGKTFTLSLERSQLTVINDSTTMLHNALRSEKAELENEHTKKRDVVFISTYIAAAPQRIYSYIGAAAAE